MSTAICVLCFKFQSQNGTLGTKLDTRSILCFIHEKLSLERFIFAFPFTLNIGLSPAVLRFAPKYCEFDKQTNKGSLDSS